MMMGLTPGLLVRTPLLFALKIMLVVLTIPLVMFVEWIMEYFFPMEIDSNCDVVQLVMFVPIGAKSKGGPPIEIFWRPKS